MNIFIILLVLLIPGVVNAQMSSFSMPEYDAVNTALTIIEIGNQIQQEQVQEPNWVNLSRGKMSARTFVEAVLEANGLKYQKALGKIPKGKIGVLENLDGALHLIEPGTFDSNSETFL